jgi:phosphatidylserine decarboxylase
MFDNIVAKEGHKKILFGFITFLIFVIIECGFLAFLSFASVVFFIYAYRYKYIDVKTLKEDEVYAPISGRVSAIDIKDLKKKIYIDVSLCNSHILRSLDSGETKVSIKRGLNLCASSFKSKKLNEKASIEYKNSSLELLSSVFNDSINIDEKIGTFLQGQVVVVLDKDYESTITIGQKVESGQTVLARVKNNS